MNDTVMQIFRDASGLDLARSRIATLAERIETTLRIARVLAESGRSIDLGGLENEVGRLCAGMLDLPPDEGRAFRHRLDAQCQALDGLAAILRRDGMD